MGIAFVAFAVLVLLFSAFAKRLGQWNVTAPMAFVAAGAVIGFAVESPDPQDVLWVKIVAEVALALILFHDAAQVRPGEIAGDRGLIARLLGVGFPLTLIGGFIAARLIFPEHPVMLSLLLAAALAPTDAGLGAATVLNPIVPARIRRLLNVESGLNDGLATPVALFAIAALAGSEGLGAAVTLAEAGLELVLGVIVGVVVGVVGAGLLGWSRTHTLSTPETRALGVACLPVIAFGGADLVHGNGFVAAFIAGTALAGAGAWLVQEHSAVHLTEVLTGPLGFAVWSVFGLVAVPRLWDHVGWREFALALLSLTVLRMAPVALALLGTGMRAPTVAFLGWFGPRGLASVVFALIAIESLDVDDSLRSALSTIILTVALSVVAHGLSAPPLARRYGEWIAATLPDVETRPPAKHEPDHAPRPRGSILRAGGAPPPPDRGGSQ